MTTNARRKPPRAVTGRNPSVMRGRMQDRDRKGEPAPGAPTSPPRPRAAPGVASRAAAARVLVRWLRHGAFPDRIPADAPDRAFVMDLVYRVVRLRRTLDWVIEPRFRRPVGPEVRALAWIGACQLLFDEATPDHAAVAATVEAARQLQRRSTGLVNAVLRSIQRDRQAVLTELAAQPLGIRVSHPDVLLNRWLQIFGPSQTEALCAWNNEPARTVLTTLPGRPDVATLVERFESAGISGTEAHPADPRHCLVLPRGIRVNRLPGYAEGDFTVQDPATLEVVRLLALEPGLRVLDACAAPGGKAARIAAGIGPQGRLIALERHADRLAVLNANRERLGLSWMETIQADATSVDPDVIGAPFDRILIDAPCTNTGVLRRRPDARWRFSLERLQNLCALQTRLLSHLFPMLASGGRLVYATCSLEPEENAALIAAFVETHPTAVCCDTATRHPVRDGTDGMFAAVLTRRETGVRDA